MEHLDGKEKILKVAMDLIMKHGYNAVSIRKIVKQANVSIGTLYYHFPQGKLSILNGILKSIGEEFFDINKFPDKLKYSADPKLIKDTLNNLLLIIRKYSPLIQGILMEIFTNKSFSEDLQKVMKSNQDQKDDKFYDLIHNFVPESSGRERSFVIFGNIILNIIFVHVFLKDFYGSDEDLVEVLTSMVKGFFSKYHD